MLCEKNNKRELVYALIDGERSYQNHNVCDSVEEDMKTPIANWVLFMERYITRAKVELLFGNERRAMNEIRKATSYGVAAMEYNNTPERN